MKAEKYLICLIVAVLIFMCGDEINSIRNGVRTSAIERQGNLHAANETVPRLMETESSIKNNVNASPVNLRGNITVRVERFVSSGGDKCYRYVVDNDTDQEVRAIDVGKEKGADLNELAELPLGWSQSTAHTGFEESRNSRSLVEPIATEDQDKIFVTTKSFRAAPRNTNGFEVCVQNEWDVNYQTSHWIAYLYDGSEIAGKLESLSDN
jgi:hypothetical protein